MATFSIKDIESLTGIKSHTLRIWEQRFGFLKPKRTETNIRYYDDEDLKLLLNISVLNNHNVKISEIAKMTASEMSNSIVKLSDNSNKFTNQIKDLISSMMLFDEFGFHSKLNELINDIGLEDTYIMSCAQIMKNKGLQVQQYVLKNEIIVKNSLYKFNPYKGYLSIIDKKDELDADI